VRPEGTLHSYIHTHTHTWADHLIPGLIFFRETIIHRKVATEWDTWQLCAIVCAKPEVGISLDSLCGSLSVNVYLQCASHLRMEGKMQQRVCIDFCFRLGKTGAETYEMLQVTFGESCLSRLSGIPVDTDPLKTTPPRQAIHLLHRGDRGTCARNHTR